MKEQFRERYDKNTNENSLDREFLPHEHEP